MKKKIAWGICFFLQILLLIFFVSRCVGGNVTIPVSLDAWSSDVLTVTEDGWYIDESIAGEDWNSEISMIYGPYLSLEKGTYTVHITYEADSEQSAKVYVSTDVNHFLKETEVTLLATETEKTFEFELSHAMDGVELATYYSGEGAFSITGITIEKNHHMDTRNFVMVFVILLLLDLALWKWSWMKERKETVFSVLLISFLASLPLFAYGIQAGHDFYFHLGRIEGIATELATGHFPVRMQSIWNNGYSYPVSIYYGDVTLYLPAILRLLGFSVIQAYKIYVYVINLLTVVFFYWAAKEIWKKRNTALLVTAAFTLCTYRFVDLYVRAAVGEYTCMLFFPFVLVGIWRIYFCREEQKGKINWSGCLSLVVGMSGMIVTHVLTTEMVCMVLVVFAVIYWKITCKKDVLLGVLSSVLGTVGMTLWFIVPFLDYYGNVDVHINRTVGNTLLIERHGAYVLGFFAVFQDLFGESPVQSITEKLSLTPGLLLIVMLVVAGALIVKGKAGRQTKIFIGISLWLLFMSSNLFPWNAIAESSKLGNMLTQVQFPWRWMTFVCLFLTILSATTVADLLQFLPEYKKLVKVGVVGLLAIQVAVYASNYADSATNIVNPWYQTDLSLDNIAEYYRAESDFYVLTYQVDGEIVEKAELVSQSGTDFVFYVKTSQGGSVTLPVMNYKGFTVWNDNGTVYEITDGAQKEVQISLTDAYEGNIYVSFVEPTSWRVAEGVSAVCILGFVMAGILMIKKGRKQHEIM